MLESANLSFRKVIVYLYGIFVYSIVRYGANIYKFTHTSDTTDVKSINKNNLDTKVVTHIF
jgi:hypothetical protein